MSLYFFNTLSRKKEELQPSENMEVKMYACGPTVYNYVHIGNLRAYIFEDILRRVLEYNNLKVKHIENITDVGHLVSDADSGEDKMMKALKREGLSVSVESLKALAQKYTKAFQEDIELLNILPPHKWTPATSYIQEMIKFIKQIESNGYTYETNLAFYFDVSKYSDYTKLSQQRLEEKVIGARNEVEIDKQKRNAADFVLWFKLAGKNKNHVMHWSSPWGEGFPGWHIECSAMSINELGESIDIHCGGVDHISVHHTNERAQNFAAYKKEVVRFWMHNEFLVLDKEKMSKSAGTFLKLQDIIKKGYNPLSYRYLCLNTHYRQKLQFSFEALTSSQNALYRLYDIISEYGEPNIGCAEYEERFLKAVNDDLNIPKALGILWELVDDKEMPDVAKKQTMLKFDKVLGLGFETIKKLVIPQSVQELVLKRQLARDAKDWEKADKIRLEILKLGYYVEDTESGPKIFKKR